MRRQAGDVVVGQRAEQGRLGGGLRQAWDYANAGGRVALGRVIVEGFIDFDYEITLLTVRARDASGEIGHSFCEPIGHVQVAGDYVESWQPHPMSASRAGEGTRLCAAVTDDLGGTGIFGVELFVKGDDVWFSEVSPRPHDTGMVTMATQWQNEFELHARALLGLPVDTSAAQRRCQRRHLRGHEARALVFDGVAEALALPGVELRLFGKPESFVKRRMGVALARASSTDEARRLAKTAAARVRPRPGG